jgi:predicted RNA binding protein YcfA (HicA-like mRNA interferase family)
VPSDFPVNKACNSLRKKGFREKTGGDHYRFFYWHNDKKTSVHTKFSHQRHIPFGILNLIRKQLRLAENGQLERLLSCDMGAEEYRDHLKESDEI